LPGWLVFDVAAACVVATIEDPVLIRRILTHLGLPTEASAPRPPPYQFPPLAGRPPGSVLTPPGVASTVTRSTTSREACPARAPLELPGRLGAPRRIWS